MWKRLLRLSPVVVLCAVAGWQLARAHSTELSPWKGGGFGMFSTVDAPTARYIKVHLITADDRAIPARVDLEDESLWQLVKADPSEKHLAALADFLAARGWQRLWETTDQPSLRIVDSHDDQAVAAGTSALELDQPPPRALRVELWRMTYDARGDRLQGRVALTIERPFD